MLDRQLAFLGMGGIGSAISKNLAQNGDLAHPIILWNRTTSKAEAHAAKVGGAGAISVAKLEDAVARADMVWSSLASFQAVRECFDRILENVDVKGKLFVECSTGPSDATNELASRVIARGAEFVAMPVFGEPSMANAAILTCLPAGAPESVGCVLPYLKGVIAKAVVDMSGQAPGAASHLKLIGNVLIIEMIQSVAEAHVLAEKTSLPPTYLDQVVQNVWGGPTAIYSARMLSGEYYKTEPIVNIGMAKHVASIVLKLANGSGTDLTAYKIGAARLDAVEASVGPNGDIAGMYGVVREESGMKYQN